MLSCGHAGGGTRPDDSLFPAGGEGGGQALPCRRQAGRRLHDNVFKICKNMFHLPRMLRREAGIVPHATLAKRVCTAGRAACRPPSHDMDTRAARPCRGRSGPAAATKSRPDSGRIKAWRHNKKGSRNLRDPCLRTGACGLVPRAGLEPAQLLPLPPQDSVSTSSTTSAAERVYTRSRGAWQVFFQRLFSGPLVRLRSSVCRFSCGTGGEGHAGPGHVIPSISDAMTAG